MMWKCAAASVALLFVLAPVTTWADTVESVEGARAKERQGRWLDRQDRESLRRWGGNDDYGRYDYGYSRHDRRYYDYDYGPVYYYRAYPY